MSGFVNINSSNNEFYNICARPISPVEADFILLDNGVTVRYTGSTPNATGYINDDPDTYPTLYTAVDQTAWDALNPITDDYTNKCTTLVTDMSNAFNQQKDFNQDISHFDTVNVISMANMFTYSNPPPFGPQTVLFNQNISFWDVSNVINMDAMFYTYTPFGITPTSSFNQDLSGWCVEQIPSEPTNFATGVTSWILPKPNWGTPC